MLGLPVISLPSPLHLAILRERPWMLEMHAIFLLKTKELIGYVS